MRSLHTNEMSSQRQYFLQALVWDRGSGSSVVIATDYELDGPGSISTSRYVPNAAAKTPITAQLYWLLASRQMEVIPGGQPDAADTKLYIDTLDSARSVGENPRKEQAVVKMGHGVGRGTHTPLEWSCASVSARWHGMGVHYQNTRQKQC